VTARKPHAPPERNADATVGLVEVQATQRSRAAQSGLPVLSLPSDGRGDSCQSRSDPVSVPVLQSPMGGTIADTGPSFERLNANRK
jgi:hypothetical protein